MAMQRLSLVFLLLSAPLYGQQRGSITGQVQLPGGKPAGAGIQVNASSLNSGLIAGGQTDVNGGFRIGNLPAGQYRVFAAARVQAVTENGETIPMIVPSARQGPIAGAANGTYFPGSANIQEATAVPVSSDLTSANINIVLAPGVANSNLAFRILRGKFVADGGGFATIGENELDLIFSDGPANVFSEVTFIGAFRRPAPEAARFDQLSGPKGVRNVFSMPTKEDGQFRLVLPEGEFRVSPQGPMRNNGHGTRYYIKSMSYGTMDLMRDLMTLRGSNQNELVITLAKCTADSTKEPMCS
jgi:hypothetical protein